MKLITIKTTNFIEVLTQILLLLLAISIDYKDYAKFMAIEVM